MLTSINIYHTFYDLTPILYINIARGGVIYDNLYGVEDPQF